MKRFQKILVGVDVRDRGAALTPGSRAALTQALWLARASGARVDVLHSTWDDPEQAGSVALEGERGARSEVERRLAESGLPGEPWSTDPRRPLEALVGRVLAGGYDLVVTGKRSHLDRSERRLGTLSRKLIHACPGRVLVVHPGRDTPPRSFLAATDLSAVGDGAVEQALALARDAGGRLDVVHAWQLPMDLQLSAARIGAAATHERRERIAEEARRHILAQPGLGELDPPARLHLACDAPSRWILHVVEEVEPDLVVMGTVSRGGLVGWLIGNTAERVFEDLDTSLLTVKPDGPGAPVPGDGAHG